jgi:hypothetical protein
VAEVLRWSSVVSTESTVKSYISGGSDEEEEDDSRDDDSGLYGPTMQNTYSYTVKKG